MFCIAKITPKFSVNHSKSQKLYFESQLFTQQGNISYKGTFNKILFQNKVLYPNTSEIVGTSWHSNISHTKLATFCHTV